MANSFINTDQVARDASIILENHLVMANLVNRKYEKEFAKYIGDTVEITVVPQQTARDFVDDSLSTTASDITESSTDLVLEKWPYIQHVITSKEKSLEIEDFNELVVKPAVMAIRDDIDDYLIAQAVAGFAPNTVSGTGASTVAKLVNARKELNDNKAPLDGRVAVLSTTSDAALLQLDQFTSADYEDSPKAIREAILGRKYGMDIYIDQNVGTQDQGDVGSSNANTLAANVASTATSCTIDDGSGTSTGTINKGARFTIAGTSTVYTVTADSTASGGEFAVSFTPAATESESDGETVTWATALKEDILFCKNSVVGAIVAPAPLAIGSSISTHNGIGIRVSLSSSTSALNDTITFDTFLGGEVIQTAGGCVI